MEHGTVKWFNAEKVTVLSHVKMAAMFSFTSPQSKAKVTRLLKKAKR
ncbi:hypothetical protein AAULR_08366 [Lacticaseibacillus rhamnosus MTCC 5462]|nr:hypothetical protein AAULR_08366 [Lacticaseibacillus rhamnosus MTCC 5462]